MTKKYPYHHPNMSDRFFNKLIKENEKSRLENYIPPKEGTKKIDSTGYVYVYTGKAWRKEHFVVMEKEKKNSKYPHPIIHHVNLDKTDNRKKNLYLCNHKKHWVAHGSLNELTKELMKKNIVVFDKKIGKYEINSNIKLGVNK